MTPTPFDTLETRDPELRERAILAALPLQVAHAKARAPAFAQRLAGIDAAAVTTRAALAAAARHAQVGARASCRRARGRSAASRRPAGATLAHVFASPGGRSTSPTAGAPTGGGSRASLHAAGFRRGDLVHNTFSYHMTPAGFMLESGAHALGCTVFPGGTGQTEQQVQAMADLAPDGYVGTPSFLRILLEKADEQGIALPSLRKALVSGEAFLPQHRECAEGARHRRLPGLRDRGPRQHRLRDAGARGARRRRGRAGRDRAAGHRRPGAGRRGRRGRRDAAGQCRLPADPLRHRRPVGGAARPLALRADEPAHQGLDGPRRPDDEGQGHVRASRPGRRRSSRAIRRSRARGSSSRTRTATTA